MPLAGEGKFLWRVDVRGRYLNQDIVNTFQYVASGDWGDRNNTDNVHTLFVDPAQGPYQLLLDCMSDGYISRQIIVARESSFPAVRYASYYSVNDSGTITETGLPSQVSAVVLRTCINRNNRTVRGRLFVGAVPAIYTDAGRIITASPLDDALQLLAARLPRSLDLRFGDAISYSMSPSINQSRRVTAPGREFTWQGITDGQVRDRLGTMRHRQPGHGRRG